MDEDVWVRHWVSLLNYGRWELSVIPGWTGNLLSNMQFFAGSRYNYGKILLYLRLAFSKTTNTNKHMPKFLITTKSRTQFNGIRIEPGMSVEVVTTSFANPLLVNGGQPVIDAFRRIYGIDIKKAGVCSPVYLDVKQIV